MTFGYGSTDAPYGTPAHPYHRCDDWYMPDGTPIVVNGVQIGVSGHTGMVTGPHCHVGRFVGGVDTNPQSRAWSVDNPRVTDIGYDTTDGNYVGLIDSGGVRWIYLHMQSKSTDIAVGDYLSNVTPYRGGDMADGNAIAIAGIRLGRINQIAATLNVADTDEDAQFSHIMTLITNDQADVKTNESIADIRGSRLNQLATMLGATNGDDFDGIMKAVQALQANTSTTKVTQLAPGTYEVK